MLLAWSDAAKPANRPTDGRLPVFAGIPPLAYLVEQIGGEHVKVDVLVQPGQDPHTFEPTPQQVLALGRAAVFFKIDMPFESVLLEKVREGNRRLAVVDATRGHREAADGRPVLREDAATTTIATLHAGEPDPHVWLSPPLLKTMAANIAAGLCRADPAHERGLSAEPGRARWTSRCRSHQRIGRMLAPYRGRSFYVFHPGFGYFADAYGLKEEAVEAGGQSPTPKQLRALIEKAKAEGVKTVFVQPEYDPQSAQVVAEAIGGQVVPINGLGEERDRRHRGHCGEDREGDAGEEMTQTTEYECNRTDAHYAFGNSQIRGCLD